MDHDRHDTRIGCYAWIRDGARVLLTHFRLPGGPERSGWTLPGGGIEPGETPLDCLVREVAEETGYEARPGRLLGVVNRWIDADERYDGVPRPLHVLQLCYAADIVGGAFEVEQDGSTDDARWVDLAELDSYDPVPVAVAARTWAQGPGRTSPSGP